MRTYDDLKAILKASGVDAETAGSLYNAHRDSEQHAWSDQAVEWCGNMPQLIERALEDPERIAAVCDYFLACDGGLHLDGLRHLDERKLALAETVIFGGWNVAIDADDLPTPATWEPKPEAEILELVSRSVRKKYGELEAISFGQLATVVLDGGGVKHYMSMYVRLANSARQCLAETEEWEGTRGVEIRIGEIAPNSKDVWL